MIEVSPETSDRMAALNNGIVGLVDKSQLTPLEVVAVLRVIQVRLDDAFKMEVMGNPVSRMAEKLREEGDKPLKE